MLKAEKYKQSTSCAQATRGSFVSRDYSPTNERKIAKSNLKLSRELLFMSYCSEKVAIGNHEDKSKEDNGKAV